MNKEQYMKQAARGELMNSDEMKTKLLISWKMNRGCGMIATEVGDWNADVLLEDKKGNIIEIEVKISEKDFIADFKKIKHDVYKRCRAGKLQGHDRKTVPNKFYFAVPEYLLDFAKEILKGTYYGLILVDGRKLTKTGIRNKKDCKVIKRAGIINKEVPTVARQRLLIRMSWELLALKLKVVRNEYK